MGIGITSPNEALTGDNGFRLLTSRSAAIFASEATPVTLHVSYNYSALVVRDYSHHPKTHVCDIHFTTEFVGDQMIPAISTEMIKSFRSKGLRLYFDTGSTAKVQPAHARKLRLILTLLDAAASSEDMNFPGSRLHALRGELKGYYSVSVSGNWRVIFRLEGGHAYDVNYLDYH